MSTVKPRLTGDVLSYHLEEEVRTVRAHLDSTDRSARTLVKSGALRVTLVGLAPGGSMARHKADGPISIQAIEGEVVFEAGNEEWTLKAGSMLAVEPGIVHSVRSPSGGFFLLTVAAQAGIGSGAVEQGTGG